MSIRRNARIAGTLKCLDTIQKGFRRAIAGLTRMSIRSEVLDEIDAALNIRVRVFADQHVLPTWHGHWHHDIMLLFKFLLPSYFYYPYRVTRLRARSVASNGQGPSALEAIEFH